MSSMTTHRSTAWLNGHLQWHLKSEKLENGHYRATATNAPGKEAIAPEEHLAITQLKQQLREAAVKGEM